MGVIAVGLSTYPDSGFSRTRSDAIREIAEHEGGASSNAQLDRAARTYDATVKYFNRFLWKFNVLTEDITLSGVDSNSEVSLSNRIKAPQRMVLIDSDGVQRNEPVRYMRLKDYLYRDPSEVGTYAIPRAYTFQNLHETGKVRFIPRLDTANLTYPKARLWYYRYIEVSSQLGGRLNVPEDVEQAIVEWATAKFIAKVRTHGEAAAAMRSAQDTFLDIEQEHREYGEIEVREEPY